MGNRRVLGSCFNADRIFAFSMEGDDDLCGMLILAGQIAALVVVNETLTGSSDELQVFEAEHRGDPSVRYGVDYVDARKAAMLRH
jgi:hypothetical protein